jgi:hypothetical protein
MLAAIKRIRQLVDRRHPPGHLPYRVEDIRTSAQEVTDVDRIRFFEFPGEEQNPVKGRFRRYEGELGCYVGCGTVVEIDYDSTLNFCWTRFVLVKEMCHSLEKDRTVRVSDFGTVERLIEAFRVPDPSGAAFAFPPFGSEKMAEFCALELLCPIRDRIKIVERRAETKLSDMQIATAFRIPVHYVTALFAPSYVHLMSRILKAV